MVEVRSEGGNESTSPPFRFMYMSGTAAERDQTKTPSFMPQYSLMRVSTVYTSQRSHLAWLLRTVVDANSSINY